MAAEEIIPFRVDIPQREVERLYEKLLKKEQRHPNQDVVPNAGHDYGLPTSWALDLVDYWTNSYSWTKAQDAMNRFRHFTTKIEDLDIHFIH